MVFFSSELRLFCLRAAVHTEHMQVFENDQRWRIRGSYAKDVAPRRYISHLYASLCCLQGMFVYLDYLFLLADDHFMLSLSTKYNMVPVSCLSGHQRVHRVRHGPCLPPPPCYQRTWYNVQREAARCLCVHLAQWPVINCMTQSAEDYRSESATTAAAFHQLVLIPA